MYKKKFFSIVTPSFNRSKFIYQTIKSIHSQSFKDFEHIIVDGKSTDGTINILKKLKKKYNFKLLIKKDNSMYEAIKYGFENGNGKYYYWLNSDDFLYDKNSLLNLYKVLKKKQYQWINGRTAIYNQNDKKLIKWIPLAYPSFIIRNGLNHDSCWGFIQQENTVFSSKLYNRVGGINHKFKQAGDYMLWKSFSKYQKLIPINVHIGVHRKWDQQLTSELYYKEIGVEKKKINFFYFFRFLYSMVLYPLVFFRK